MTDKEIKKRADLMRNTDWQKVRETVDERIWLLEMLVRRGIDNVSDELSDKVIADLVYPNMCTLLCFIESVEVEQQDDITRNVKINNGE